MRSDWYGNVHIFDSAGFKAGGLRPSVIEREGEAMAEEIGAFVM